MKLSVIFFAIMCSMPVIEARRCKRRSVPEDPCDNVACNKVTIASSADNGLLISYRLCDGGGPGVCVDGQGRLEVYYNNQWGSVCSNGWSDYLRRIISFNANVACQMFGFTDGSQIYAWPAPADFPIHIDNVQCTGGEPSIAECPHAPWGPNGCVHAQDIGVNCFNFR